MAEMLNVIIKAPGKAPTHRTIPNTLDALQEIVGGFVQAVTLPEGLVILMNEEGKFMRLRPNFNFRNDIVVGNVIFCGHDEEQFADCPWSIEELEKKIRYNTWMD